MYSRNKILRAIDSGKLSLKTEGERRWFSYRIRITILYWRRNLFDGYKIEIYDGQTYFHLDTIII